MIALTQELMCVLNLKLEAPPSLHANVLLTLRKRETSTFIIHGINAALQPGGIHMNNWVLFWKRQGVLQKTHGPVVFHGQFQFQTRDPAVYNKVLLGVGGLQALYKPYMLIKQHIKFLTAARKIANFLS